MKSDEELIRLNRTLHDKYSDRYDKQHGEIFNPIEQERLRKHLEKSIGFIHTASDPQLALDYGCGTGNLTNHLIDLGFYVTSADISEKFLSIVGRKFGNSGRCETVRTNGGDLTGIADGRFDFVGVYSVLHHVPDYLKIIRELIRVTRRGGIVYIDHEVNENFWNRNETYEEFLRLFSGNKNQDGWHRLYNPTALMGSVVYKIQTSVNPLYRTEGDIHVRADDFIDWKKIADLVRAEQCEVVMENDYLLYRPAYPREIFDEYKDRINDCRVLAARKL